MRRSGSVYPVRLYDADLAEAGVSDYAQTIYRLAIAYNSELELSALFFRFLANPASAQTPAIIIGQCHGDDPSEGTEEAVELLVSARSKLPRLRGIFLGDLISEETRSPGSCKRTFRRCSSLTRIWSIYACAGPRTQSGRALDARETQILDPGNRRAAPRLLHEVPGEPTAGPRIFGVMARDASLRRRCGGSRLRPLFSGGPFPALKHLGLRDSEIADEIAGALSPAPILSRLEALDLSLGTLSDKGGQALLDNPALKQLKRLDLHRHYLSDAMMAALKKAFPGVNVNDPQGSDTKADDRYVAVSE